MERTAILSITNEELLAEIEERKRTEAQLEEYKRTLEEQVRERTAELTAVNKELEAFSYSVSHDLRAPLRQMSGFVELLQRQVADHPNEKIHQYLTSMITASRKMDGLIMDLLALSHIGRKEMRKRKVDLNVLVKEVADEIQHEFKERKINWEIDALPDVIGDCALLRLVLVNLLSNAAKFTSTRQQAKIKIGCNGDDDKFTCSIADNGVGFDMKYVDRLFGVFQRLHTQEEFEGTGIGLANVQRIISRHGGRVWAEGSLGKGAIFFFTLPKTKEK
jgi:light-regulated signal transduction histidine kinase (bacteriophytochrome)